MGRICDRCGRAVPRGAVHRCPLAPERRVDRARERERHAADEWRRSYSRRAYERARRAVIELCHGRCEACGAPVFERTGRGWRRVSGGSGATHHVVPLSQGGSDSEPNLAVLCARCHGLAHSRGLEGALSKGELLSRIRRELGAM